LTWNTDVTERQCDRTPKLRHPSAADSRLTNQRRPSSIDDSPLADDVLPRIRKEQQHRFHDVGVSTSAAKSSSSRTRWQYVTVACCLQLTATLQYLSSRRASQLRTKRWGLTENYCRLETLADIGADFVRPGRGARARPIFCPLGSSSYNPPPIMLLRLLPIWKFFCPRMRFISVATGQGGAKGSSCPPTGPGLYSKIRTNPIRSVNAWCGETSKIKIESQFLCGYFLKIQMQTWGSKGAISIHDRDSKCTIYVASFPRYGNLLAENCVFSYRSLIRRLAPNSLWNFVEKLTAWGN